MWWVYFKHLWIDRRLFLQKWFFSFLGIVNCLLHGTLQLIRLIMQLSSSLFPLSNDTLSAKVKLFLLWVWGSFLSVSSGNVASGWERFKHLCWLSLKFAANVITGLGEVISSLWSYINEYFWIHSRGISSIIY